MTFATDRIAKHSRLAGPVAAFANFACRIDKKGATTRICHSITNAAGPSAIWTAGDAFKTSFRCFGRVTAAAKRASGLINSNSSTSVWSILAIWTRPGTIFAAAGVADTAKRCFIGVTASTNFALRLLNLLASTDECLSITDAARPRSIRTTCDTFTFAGGSWWLQGGIAATFAGFAFRFLDKNISAHVKASGCIWAYPCSI